MIDPTMPGGSDLPFTPITIDGKEYRMCFDYEALALAETALIESGHTSANILFCLPKPTFANVRTLFAVSLHHYHPGLDFEAAKRLVNFVNLETISNCIYGALLQAMPPREEQNAEAGDPPQPAQ